MTSSGYKYNPTGSFRNRTPKPEFNNGCLLWIILLILTAGISVGVSYYLA
jgi:hypothetical protein